MFSVEWAEEALESRSMVRDIGSVQDGDLRCCFDRYHTIQWPLSAVIGTIGMGQQVPPHLLACQSVVISPYYH